MEPSEIAGKTHSLGAPRDWNEDKNGPCARLPVRAIQIEGGVGMMFESAWKPSPEEIAALQNGGQVILRTYGVQPAVALYVELPA
jgi:hypothetical protein